MSLIEPNGKSNSYSIPQDVKTHACLMLFAWGFCSTNGFIVSRHFKLGWPGQTMRNWTYWFNFHLLFQSFLLAFVVLSLFVIVAFVTGYSKITAAPFYVHPALGFTIVSLTFLNPLFAWFLITSTGPRRSVFRNFHLCTGLLAQMFSVPQMFIGFNMPSLGNKLCKTSLFPGLYLASVILYVIVEVVLEVLGYMILFKKKELKSRFQNDELDVDAVILDMAKEPREKRKIAAALLPNRGYEERQIAQQLFKKIHLLRILKYFIFSAHLLGSFTLIFVMVTMLAHM
ncbi:unnamed protein product [Calicophoron daubneyi]|uniref:Cytochrome b561 domain-containing protein n=1 Tax=Calicophoron daubneyi TaxID=300641 RepID=A0AAV2TUI3_CALDB